MDSQRTSCGSDSGAGGGMLHTWRGYSCSVSPERLLLPRPVLQVALGARHGIVLLEGGQVYSFGNVPWKQSQVLEPSKPWLESALGGQRVVAIAAGDFHSGAVTEDGGVHMWGDNSAGQCGLSGLASVPNPTPVAVVDWDAGPSHTVAVLELACGEKHTLALSVQREVWAWGGPGAAASPTWRPQKVEQLAGRCVLQVACGASHSLALVRCLGPDGIHRPPVDKCGQCNQLLYTMTDKEDHVIISDSHSCLPGAEPTEEERRVEAPAATQGLKTSPSEPALPSHTSSLDTAEPFNLFSASRDASSADGPTPCSTHSTCSNHSGKSSLYPDEQTVKDYLKKLSQQPPEAKTAGPHSLVPSVVPSSSSTLNSLVASCASAVGERVASTYEALSLRKMMNLYLPSGAPRPDALPVVGGILPAAGSVLPGPGDVLPAPGDVLPAPGLRQEDNVQAKKSCSTGDIHQEEAGGGRRRLSLPGLLSQVSPLLLRRSSRPRPGGVGLSLVGVGAPEVEKVVPSLQTEVWSWGGGEEGQLGHGDNLDRLQPSCIRSLTNQQVVRLAAGARHSVALTAQCQVYSWGSNRSGQLGHMESPSTVPRPAKLSEGVRVWDVSAGEKHTVLLADGDCVQPLIYYSGQQVEQQAEQQVEQQAEQQAGGYTQQPVLLPFCMNLGYVSSVCAGGQRCAALSDRNMMGFVSSLHELAAAERKFYCKLGNIKSHVLRPLLELDSVSWSLGSSSLGLLQTLVGCFNLLCHLTGQHATSLTSNLRRSRQVNHLLLLEHIHLFLDAYTEYCSAVGHFQVMGGFHALAKPLLDVFGKSSELLQKLSECRQDNANMADLLVVLFYIPARHLQEYTRLLLKLTSCFEVSSTEHQQLQQTCSRIEACRLQLLRRKKASDQTLHFWRSFPGKMTDSLRKPQRRLLCENSNKAVTLQNAGRFSVNWFILFNDALVHAQFSTHHIFPVATLWVEVLSEEEAGYALKVITPEETFTLLASSSSEKIKWLGSLNQAVEEALSRVGQVGGQDSLGQAGEGGTPRQAGEGGTPRQAGEGAPPGQNLEPLVSRTASYTFYKEGRLKDATYEGQWINGKPHGRGTLSWPDGRVYTGEFFNGLEDGLGNFVAPNKLQKKKDRYEGQWKEGRMHGWGTYSCASGEVYEGWFQDGLRHGHGVLRSGRLTSSSPSVFVGRWRQDKRTGYGVLDDITKGEKFMGMWQDQLRQGPGVVVTQFGLYYEGTFRDNRMMGTGILLSEDDTTYEGDFCDDWTLSGKGVLTMANGDYLEGSFTGLWGSALKVTGSYFKPHLFDSDKDKTRAVKLGQLCVRADDKWQDLFDECWKQLGVEEADRGESRKQLGGEEAGRGESRKQLGGEEADRGESRKQLGGEEAGPEESRKQLGGEEAGPEESRKQLGGEEAGPEESRKQLGGEEAGPEESRKQLGSEESRKQLGGEEADRGESRKQLGGEEADRGESRKQLGGEESRKQLGSEEAGPEESRKQLGGEEAGPEESRKQLGSEESRKQLGGEEADRGESRKQLGGEEADRGESRKQLGGEESRKQLGSEEAGPEESRKQLGGEEAGPEESRKQLGGEEAGPEESRKQLGSEEAGPEESRKQLGGEEAGPEESRKQLGGEEADRGESRKQLGGEEAGRGESMAVALTCSPHRLHSVSWSHSRSLEVPQHQGPFSMEQYHAIRLYLLQACDSPLHPLGRLLESLVAVYRMTYVGVGANRRLLPQAVQEIKSYLHRMFHIIRFVFPDLPEEGGLIPEPPGSNSNLQDKDPDSAESPLESLKPSQVVSSWALLLPVLLPRLYPPLFTLYALDREREDDLYWECVRRLNKQADLALLAFLGVQQKFWPVSVPSAPPAPPAPPAPAQKLQVVSSSKDVCFTSAVETLQQISTTFTPSDKLQVIQLTFEEITQEVQVLLKHDFLWSMDDLFPVFLYVVVRARIRNLGSEVNLMEDLMDPCIQHGEHGIMFTTLKACYYQIQHEKIT